MDAKDIRRLILEALDAARLEHSKALYDGIIHVTEALMCPRLAYLQRVERASQPRIGDGTGARMALGTAVHEILEEQLRRRGWLTEVPVLYDADGVKLIGFVDAFDPRTRTLVEIKTVGASVPSKPYWKHKVQAAFYAGVLGARRAYIVYISRMDGSVDVHPVDLDYEDVREYIVERARRLARFLERGEEPPAEPGPWCRSCPFRDRCPYARRYEAGPARGEPRVARERGEAFHGRGGRGGGGGRRSPARAVQTESPGGRGGASYRGRRAYTRRPYRSWYRRWQRGPYPP